MPRLNFCPRCANPLTTRSDGGRDRQACPDVECGFVHFGDFSIGCSAVVLREEAGQTKALLIQRGQEPFAGTWQVPGGYAEHDELLASAVEREVQEESAIEAKFQDVVGFRHMTVGPSTNVYIICRLRYEGGEPNYDGVETADARFFSMDELYSVKGVQNISRWGIRQALNTPVGAGLSIDLHGSDPSRWQLFGLTDIDPGDWR